jgi:hypothetical protein
MRIVPDDVPTNDPKPLAEMIDQVEGCLVAIAPGPQDIEPTSEELRRLDKAFTVITQRNSGHKSRFEMLIGPHGDFSFSGFTFLFDPKIADSVRSSLGEHNLLGKHQQKIAKGLGSATATVVRKDAAALILSLIADHLARRNGLSTITDQPLEHLMTALNGLSIPVYQSQTSAEGMLTAAFASVLIPSDIASLRIEDYRIFRSSYADIRTVMTEFVHRISDFGRFDRIGDVNVLQSRVNSAAQNLAKELEKYKKTTFAKRVAHWVPLVISSLLRVVIRECDPSPALDVGTEIGLKFLEKVPMGQKSSQDHILRLATDLEHNVKALLP